MLKKLLTFFVMCTSYNKFVKDLEYYKLVLKIYKKNNT